MREEMKALFNLGFMVVMGVNRLPEIRDYWSVDPKLNNAFSSSTFVSHVVLVFAVVRHSKAYLFVSRTMCERMFSSKKCENISRGSRLTGTSGPTWAVHGGTWTAVGVVVQPIDM